MKKLPTTILAIATILLMLLALSPWTPRFSELASEAAVVQEIDTNHYMSRWTAFKTAAGLRVTHRCSSKRSWCIQATEKLSGLKTSAAPVRVWHDQEYVYQIATEAEVLVAYERGTEGTDMIWLLCLLSSIALVIRLGMHVGLINRWS
jgi:hypothetical protein